ncbi:MAG: hypothetical protein QM539_10255 [Alphaproteobacteria bacterium]|nr:hypothetical protein [Alphaproteobacteria bacterium]
MTLTSHFDDTLFILSRPKKEILNGTIHLLFVSTNCEFCHKVLDVVCSEKFQLKTNQLVVVFLNSAKDVKEYTSKQKKTSWENIYLYSDSNLKIRKLFRQLDTPTIYISQSSHIYIKAVGLNNSIDLIKSLK